MTVHDDPDETNRLVDETKEYYDQRASHYFDWAHDTGDYEGEVRPDPSWYAEAKTVLDALVVSKLGGHVLEVASGTGILTEVLVKKATTVTALDSSEGMIQRCKSRLGGNPKVRYVLADFYGWTPGMAYDAVAFSFWISHVPAAKLDEFVSKVSRCLKPGGRVFFADQREEAVKYETLDRPGGEVAKRTLLNGRKFRVVKHFYSHEEIKECFLRNGIAIELSNTPIHFYYADGVKSAGFR
jgi:demethylmenaquinone methyltransferase/2-methoxy-6-polyprenyl-1,4-benzoquinol methylase